MLSCSGPGGHRANSGGPASRTRTERIRSTLLGLDEGPIRCPRALRLALEFGREDPVDAVYRLLARAGFKGPEELRAVFGQDLWPLVCRPDPALEPLDVATADPREVLRTAFLLGLCSAVRLDPQRPVLWTRAGLTRRLELFEMREYLRMKQEPFLHLLRELVEDNPFAIRPFLKLARVRFTDAVPTMAVTRQAAPELLVNLGFVTEHCHGEAQVKAVVLHEFLHILLRHTEGRGPVGDAEHLAMDAVINAIIHRQAGPGASAMMSQYYAGARGANRLLRPPAPGERIFSGDARGTLLDEAWKALYAGRLVVDDLRELAESLAGSRVPLRVDLDGLLGNHRDLGQPLPEALQEVLNKAMRTMNGGGIWRSPRGRDLGIASYDALAAGDDRAIRAWERTALKVLRKHLLPDPASRETRQVPQTSLLPVLSPGDRRSFLQALWNPILPASRWDFLQERPIGSAQVYLDVSGSMNAEMPLVIGLLNRLRRSIRMPFWAFSTQVAPARIRGGMLETATTGGTSLACVLEHIARTRPECAVIVTDGYIERLPRGLVLATRPARIHTLLTRDGSAMELDRAGLSYTQLPKVPS